MTLDYLYRYNCQPGPDHLLTALAVGADRAIVGGNQGLALLDLDALTLGGTQSYLYRLTGANARNLYLKGDYVFVNLHGSGSAAGPPAAGKTNVPRTSDAAGAFPLPVPAEAWLANNSIPQIRTQRVRGLSSPRRGAC